MYFQNKILRIILIIISFILAVNLFRSHKTLKDRADYIKDAENRLKEEEVTKIELERKLAQVQSREYIEKQIREKLNLGKEGEVVVIIPSISPKVLPTLPPQGKRANWQKWMEIFF